MLNHYDIAYGLAVGLASPYWLTVPAARRKWLTAFRQRMGQVAPRNSGNPSVLIHAVSLGEMNATRSLVAMLQQARPDLHVIVSTTTTTGYDRGQQLYASAPNVTLIRYPLDFTRAITRVLDRLRPGLVVLMELEVWPNFTRQCSKRNIPVIVINGRLTESSFKRYRSAGLLTRPMFQRLAHVCVQDGTYAQRFAALGVAADRIQVTGTMKFDTAAIASRVEGDAELAQAVGYETERPLWVCGSTGPGEEEIVLKVYHDLLSKFPRLRLAIIPRKPERFDEVAQLIESHHFKVIRRSKPQLPTQKTIIPPIILGDTMGELRKFYSLATVVFVGRSLVDMGPRQHGSDMIEPAALAKPVIVGPYTSNFAEVMARFKAADSMIEVRDAAGLAQALEKLLSEPSAATAMARRAQQVVQSEKGATERHVKVVLERLAAQA